MEFLEQKPIPLRSRYLRGIERSELQCVGTYTIYQMLSWMPEIWWWGLQREVCSSGCRAHCVGERQEREEPTDDADSRGGQWKQHERVQALRWDWGTERRSAWAEQVETRNPGRGEKKDWGNGAPGARYCTILQANVRTWGLLTTSPCQLSWKGHQWVGAATAVTSVPLYCILPTWILHCNSWELASVVKGSWGFLVYGFNSPSTFIPLYFIWVIDISQRAICLFKTYLLSTYYTKALCWTLGYAGEQTATALKVHFSIPLNRPVALDQCICLPASPFLILGLCSHYIILFAFSRMGRKSEVVTVYGVGIIIQKMKLM